MRGEGLARRPAGVATRIFRLRAVPFAVLAFSVAAPAPSSGRDTARREVRLVMGTTAEIRVAGLPDPVPALDAAFAALDRVDETLSLWRESELRRLNRSGEGVVSADTLAVLRHALDVAAASGGAFDPTVEPLVRAAGGFGEPPLLLDAAERRALLERVDYRRVAIDAASRRVRLAAGGGIVLDGLAKGYAADCALEALRRAGALSGLVDLGESSLAVFGKPLDVELRDPTGAERPWASLTITDASLGTSAADERPGHILDPRSGEPAQEVLQATVIAGRGIEADALSTAVFVLGAERGLALLVRRGASGLCLLVEAGRRIVRTTPGLRVRHALVAAPGVEVRE